MFDTHRNMQFKLYNQAKKHFIDNHKDLLALEEYISDVIWEIITSNMDEIERDYNEASYLFPFWQQYPPEDRGRMPIGDQYPWIEVGEHVICPKMSRLLSGYFKIRDSGVPTGPDDRYVISSDKIKQITNGLTDSCWLFIDIKSVGPRDDQEHAVMSHNQISGNGKWDSVDEGIINDVITAQGKRTSHPFYCAIPPIYVLSDGTILPVIHIALKPVYTMLNIKSDDSKGQPLIKFTQITIPNGLLLFEQPNYLADFPSLFFPGKDDKTKNPKKVRARISFEILNHIDDWRVQTVLL